MSIMDLLFTRNWRQEKNPSWLIDSAEWWLYLEYFIHRRPVVLMKHLPMTSTSCHVFWILLSHGWFKVCIFFLLYLLTIYRYMTAVHFSPYGTQRSYVVYRHWASHYYFSWSFFFFPLLSKNDEVWFYAARLPQILSQSSVDWKNNWSAYHLISRRNREVYFFSFRYEYFINILWVLQKPEVTYDCTGKIFISVLGDNFTIQVFF